MTVFVHELRQGRKSLIIWTAAIAFMLVVCVFMFPEMKGQMDGVSEMFASMGSFTAAFGMDRLDFGTFIGYYAIECGNVLGIGGALFAALVGISSVAKEEKDGTAEFLLSHPVSRFRVLSEKLAAVIVQVTAVNTVIFGLSVASASLIGEEIPWKPVLLLHLAYLIMQLELSVICFGVSAFIKRGGLGAGMGIAITLYFLNIVANIAESAEFLKYITPFGYTEGADIVAEGTLKGGLILLGVVYALLFAAAGYARYIRKDIG